jgi:hypothetical protein
MALPPGLQLVNGVIPGGSCTVGSGILNCDVDALPAGASPRATLRMQASLLGALTLAFDVSSSDFDPNTSNNAATVAVSSGLTFVETIHVRDGVLANGAGTPASGQADVTIAETIRVHDGVLANGVGSPVNGQSDFTITEDIQVHDGVLANGAGTSVDGQADFTIVETIHVLDGVIANGVGTPVNGQADLAFTETIQVHDAVIANGSGSPGTGPTDITITDTIHVTDSVTIPGATYTIVTLGGVDYPALATDGSHTPITARFTDVVVPGILTANLITTPPPPPPGFRLVGGVYDVVVTNGTVTPPIDVCFIGSGFTPASRVFHYETLNGAPQWVDRTTLQTPTRVCATVDSLSPFAVMELADVMPPTIVFEPPVPSPNAAGWHRTDVSFAFTASDSGSGVLSTSVPSPLVITGSGTGLTATVIATDRAGNAATFTTPAVRIDRTPPVVTASANTETPQTSASGAVVTYAAPAIVETGSGLASSACTPASGSTFPVGATTVTCVAIDLADNSAQATFIVTVTPFASPGNQLSRFVALAVEQIWLRANARVLSGDVGANRPIVPRARIWWQPDDVDARDRHVEVLVGAGARIEDPGSRVVGDSIWLGPLSAVFDVASNELIRNRTATVRGATASPVTLPLVNLPVATPSAPGTQDVTVGAGRTITLAPGRYRRVQVGRNAKLVLTGGGYQVLSIDLDADATVVARGAVDLQVKDEFHTERGAQVTVDRMAPLTAAQFVVTVDGDDTRCRHSVFGLFGDLGGPSAVHIGPQSVVAANIYAPNGTIWLQAQTRATGAFIGRSVRIGESVTLTLDSAFK